MTSHAREGVGEKDLTTVKNFQRSTVVPNVTRVDVSALSPETAVTYFVPVAVPDQNKAIVS